MQSSHYTLPGSFRNNSLTCFGMDISILLVDLVCAVRTHLGREIDLAFPERDKLPAHFAVALVDPCASR
jgi:hypothetical protein